VERLGSRAYPGGRRNACPARDDAGMPAVMAASPVGLPAVAPVLRAAGPLFVLAGALHFVKPRAYDTLIPYWLPRHDTRGRCQRRGRDRRQRDGPAVARDEPRVRRPRPNGAHPVPGRPTTLSASVPHSPDAGSGAQPLQIRSSQTAADALLIGH
jgi:hypothetical protein